MSTIKCFPLGVMQNNSYLIIDPETAETGIIDPSFGSEALVRYIIDNGLSLSFILLTHAHFDHIAGIPPILDGFSVSPRIGLNEYDLPLWKVRGHAEDFGIELRELPEPDLLLEDQMSILLGKAKITVFHTPGHTPGHVVFYLENDSVVFSGDLLFFKGVGRTDLPGGNEAQLLESITAKLFSLPGATRVLPGHGPETTISDEITNNPFLN